MTETPAASAAEPTDQIGYESSPPSKIHLIAAIIAGLSLISIPVVLWIHPLTFTPQPESASAIASIHTTDNHLENSASDNTTADANNVLQLGDPWIDKCEKPLSAGAPVGACDRQPWFEEALVKSIRDNADCAPNADGTMSVVLRVDHAKRQFDVFAGKSGSIRGKAAELTIGCITRSMPNPVWDSIDHEHTKYIIAVIATYSASRSATR